MARVKGLGYQELYRLQRVAKKYKTHWLSLFCFFCIRSLPQRTCQVLIAQEVTLGILG